MQEVQASGAGSSSQGNACILSSFACIKSEAAWGDGEGKSWSLPEYLHASRLCSVVLRGYPAPAAVQSSRTEGVPPTSPCGLSASPWSLCWAVTAPLDPAHWRCGRGVDVYKMLVHHLGQCSPHWGFTCLGLWISEWAGSGMQETISIGGFIEQLLETVFFLDLKEGVFQPAFRFCEHD